MARYFHGIQALQDNKCLQLHHFLKFKYAIENTHLEPSELVF